MRLAAILGGASQESRLADRLSALHGALVGYATWRVEGAVVVFCQRVEAELQALAIMIHD